MVIPELLFAGSGMGWRADPLMQAVARPAAFLSALIRLGYRTREEVAVVWAADLGGEGPAAALRHALALVGVHGDVLRWTFVQPCGQPLAVFDDPLGAPEGQRIAWLVAARSAHHQLELGRRRPKGGFGKDHLDFEGIVAMRRRCKLGPDADAALRGVQIGDVVTNRKARFWNGGHEACECGCPSETIVHRWSESPPPPRGT